MTPAAAIPLFVASIALMLVASAVFARRLDHIGLRLGLPEALLGLLTALAADAPEISSAIAALLQHEHAIAVGVVVGSNAFNLAAMLGVSAVVAGRVRARHETLELEAFVGLWLLAVMLALVGRLARGDDRRSCSSPSSSSRMRAAGVGRRLARRLRSARPSHAFSAAASASLTAGNSGSTRDAKGPGRSSCSSSRSA